MFAILTLAILGNAHGVVFKPTSNASAGPDTLRDAIERANATQAPDIIELNLIVGDITLDAPLPIIVNDLTISANSQSTKIIDGNGHSIFRGSVDSIPNLHFLSIEFRNASNLTGAGSAFSGDGTVKFTGCIFRDCQASFGGAVSFSREASFDACSFLENRASFRGGAVGMSGLRASFTNCLFQDNEAEEGGGAIALSQGQLTLNHCTLVENRATNGPGGGISAGGFATVTLLNSIIAQNSSSTGSPDLSVTDGPFFTLQEAGPNFIGGDPKLRPLSFRGGKLARPSRVPSHDSPVVDAGTDTPLAGLSLPILDSENNSFSRIFGSRPDLGAVELRLVRVTETTGTGPGTLSNTLTLHRDPGGDFDEIRLPAETILLDATLPEINHSLIVSGENGATIDGQGLYPGFRLQFPPYNPLVPAYPSEAGFENLTFRRIYGGVDGKAIYADSLGSLRIQGCQFIDCESRDLISFEGLGVSPHLTIQGCGFAGNQTVNGIFTSNEPVELSNCSFHSNTSSSGPLLGSIRYAADGRLVSHLTVTDNTVLMKSPSRPNTFFGIEDGSLHLTHSIFYNNSTTVDGSAISWVDVNGSGSFTLGPNWTSGDPLLAPLAQLSPTLTLARHPLPGSPVIDAASPDSKVDRDQSGRARPENGLADFGAVEVYQDPYRAHLALQFDSELLADHEAKETLWGSFADGDRDGSANAFELIFDGDFLDPRHQPTTPMVFEDGMVTFNFFLREAMDDGSYTIGLEKGRSPGDFQAVDPADWGGGNTVNGFTRFFHTGPREERMFYRLTLDGLRQEHPILVGVGVPGNAEAPGTPFGDVAQPFAIGRYEVTNAEFARFLNATDPNGFNSLENFDPQMESQPLGGLTLDLTRPLGSRYAPKTGRGRLPVNFVSYWAAIRYCNWLHNGATIGADTEDGAYFLDGGMPVPINLANVPRKAGARFFLPNADEWYKAAYFANDLSIGGLGLWADQPVTANTVVPSAPPGGATSANLHPGGFVLSSLQPVGSYPDASSPWGAKDMAGNVREMIEQTNTDEFPVLTPGGSAFDGVTVSSRSQFTSQLLPLSPFKGNVSTGFRIAARPN